MLLMIVPIAYVLLKFFGVRPESVFVVHIIVELFTQYARLRIVLPMIGMGLGVYFREVARPIAVVAVLSPVVPVVAYLRAGSGWWPFIFVCAVSVACTAALVCAFGCTRSERQFLVGKASAIVRKVGARFVKSSNPS